MCQTVQPELQTIQVQNVHKFEILSRNVWNVFRLLSIEMFFLDLRENWQNIELCVAICFCSDSCGDKNFIVKGRVRWQAAFFDGMQEARAKAWEKKARKQDRERVKEMAGDWILRQPPWWTHFQRPTWQIAMRLCYGLEIVPAIGRNLSRSCLAKKAGWFLLHGAFKRPRPTFSGLPGRRRRHSQA